MTNTPNTTAIARARILQVRCSQWLTKYDSLKRDVDAVGERIAKLKASLK